MLAPHGRFLVSLKAARRSAAGASASRAGRLVAVRSERDGRQPVPVGDRWRSTAGRRHGSGRIGPRCASMPREGALGGGRPAWLGLSRTHRSSMSTGSNGFQYQVTTSVWFTWSRSSAATRNSMKLGTLGTPPTSSGVELLALSFRHQPVELLVQLRVRVSGPGAVPRPWPRSCLGLSGRVRWRRSSDALRSLNNSGGASVSGFRVAVRFQSGAIPHRRLQPNLQQRVGCGKRHKLIAESNITCFAAA